MEFDEVELKRTGHPWSIPVCMRCGSTERRQLLRTDWEDLRKAPGVIEPQVLCRGCLRAILAEGRTMLGDVAPGICLDDEPPVDDGSGLAAID